MLLVAQTIEECNTTNERSTNWANECVEVGNCAIDAIHATRPVQGKLAQEFARVTAIVEVARWFVNGVLLEVSHVEHSVELLLVHLRHSGNNLDEVLHNFFVCIATTLHDAIDIFTEHNSDLEFAEIIVLCAFSSLRLCGNRHLLSGLVHVDWKLLVTAHEARQRINPKHHSFISNRVERCICLATKRVVATDHRTLSTG